MATIKWRRDTASNWSSVNPILAQGEAGLETDTDKAKIGDGVKTWSELSYFIVPSDSKVDKVTSTDNAIVVFDGVEGDVKDSTTLIDNVLDKSVGGVVNGIDITGTEQVIDGTFDIGTSNWTPINATLSLENGRMRVLSDGIENGYARYSLSLPNGVSTNFKIDCFYDGINDYEINIYVPGKKAPILAYTSGSLNTDTSIDVISGNISIIEVKSLSLNGYVEVDNVSITTIGTVDGKPIANTEDSVQKVTSTDNAIVRFDGTTGDVQDSGIIIDDDDKITIQTKLADTNVVFEIKDLAGNISYSIDGDGDIVQTSSGSAVNKMQSDGGVAQYYISANDGAIHTLISATASRGTLDTPLDLIDGDTIYEVKPKGRHNGGASLKIGSFASYVDGTPDVTSCPIGWKWDVVNSNGDTIDILTLRADGTIELPTIGQGITMLSPNGTKFKITVADDGSLTTTEVI